MLFSIISPEWRNWQTRWTQNPVVLSTVWVRPPPPGPSISSHICILLNHPLSCFCLSGLLRWPTMAETMAVLDAGLLEFFYSVANVRRISDGVPFEHFACGPTCHVHYGAFCDSSLSELASR